MLATPGRFFEKFQKMDKVYRRFYQHELAEYQFTPNEIAVILFLYNNAPDLDTATDIVRCKGISKGLVARSVDSLCREGYLTAVREPADRRIMHLKLSKKSWAVKLNAVSHRRSFVSHPLLWINCLLIQNNY